MNTFYLIFTCLHALSIIAIILVMFFQHKEPSTRLAWILVLIFMPLLGVILYFLFGHDYTRRERLKFSEAVLNEGRRFIEGQIASAPGMDFSEKRFVQLARMNMVNDQAPLLHNNRVEIFSSGAENFERLLADLRAAREYIHMLYFIFRADKLGRAVIEILTEKAAQGVDVKLVFDDLGSAGISGQAFRGLKAAGGEVFRYSPLLTSLISANYRNHCKLTVIDGRVGYTGGMNIGQEYIEGKGKLKPWRDTGLRVEGSAAGSMEALFLRNYAYAARKGARIDNLDRFFKPQKFCGHSATQLVTSYPRHGKSSIHSAYAKLIAAAEQYLYIHTPYLIPDRTIQDGLINAAASGVDVRVMLPRFPDKAFVYAASLHYARGLRLRGVRIFLYNGFLHSKLVLADGLALSIGSANLDIRSFFLSCEANVCIFDRELAEGQRAQFEQDMENCLEADEAYFMNLPRPLKAIMPVCQLFSPLL